jgi:hypothetical protein
MKQEQNISELPLDVKAEMALKEAVADVIEAHRRSGKPLVVWKDGQVVMLLLDQATARLPNPSTSTSSFTPT